KNGGFVNLENSKKIAADAVLLAVGRRLNTSIEGIEVLNLDIERGRIATDGSMRTNVKNIFAVGDVTGKSLLASVAYCQGLVAARSCAGEEQEMNYDVIPSCIFTFPEIAAVGITEQQAKERGLKVRVGKFPFSAVGRSLADGSGEGFVKIVSGHDDGRIYGCHIAGNNAGEILSEVTLAMSRGLKVKDIAEAVHIHPTLSEGVMESALAVYGLSPHIPLKK
ncbi:MAG: FAD-dependent oxidoreductase, partial [Candidatus Aureabacteria bacterium]|nr:FAD-dependent oxidoreductase [Candidatus Auribacterota bacterium]